jgi:hypothetical protein
VKTKLQIAFLGKRSHFPSCTTSHKSGSQWCNLDVKKGRRNKQQIRRGGKLAVSTFFRDFPCRTSRDHEFPNRFALKFRHALRRHASIFGKTAAPSRPKNPTSILDSSHRRPVAVQLFHGTASRAARPSSSSFETPLACIPPFCEHRIVGLERVHCFEKFLFVFGRRLATVNSPAKVATNLS